MQITVCVRRTVVVDHNVHTLHIDTTNENICRYQYTLLECFECSVAGDTGHVVAVKCSPVKQTLTERRTAPPARGQNELR